MSFDNAIIAVRHILQPLAQMTSMAGVCWRGLDGKPATCLLSAFDPNVALTVQMRHDGPVIVQQVSYVYVGRFLDRIASVGKDDFQVFRFHYHSFDDLTEEEDRPRFGERIGERWLPLETRTIVLEVEPIWGPRWEDQELLCAAGFQDQDFPLDSVFVRCPIPLAETAEEYARHNSWITHPGLLPEGSSEPEYFEMSDQVLRAATRLAVIQ